MKGWSLYTDCDAEDIIDAVAFHIAEDPNQPTDDQWGHAIVEQSCDTCDVFRLTVNGRQWIVECEQDADVINGDWHAIRNYFVRSEVKA